MGEVIKPCKLCGTRASIIKSVDEHYHVTCNKYSTIDNMCIRYLGLTTQSNSKKIVWHRKVQEAIDYWNNNN